MASAAKSNEIGDATKLPFPALLKPPLDLGERVVWLGNDVPEHGTVCWLGYLPEISNEWTAGIELDNPVGGFDGSWNGKKLFACKPLYGIVISINGLIKENDFLGNAISRVATPVPYDVTTVMDFPADCITANGPLMRPVNGPGNGPRATKPESEDGGSGNKGDRYIEKFLSAQSSPKLCNANSFDRRVYARMFAECEVEKWYEVLNFAPDRASSDVSVDCDGGGKAKKKKKDSLFHKDRDSAPSRSDEGAKKKERGGIFRFFRWLRRSRSTKPAYACGGGGPGSRRTLSSVRVSDVVTRRRTKSLESVTSLSRSFHYIPVGVMGDGERPARDSRECVYEDLATPQPSPMKRVAVAKPPSGESDVSGVRQTRSMPGAAAGSVASSLRKKRRAPLPPTPAHSAPPNWRGHWVRVLPAAAASAAGSTSDLQGPDSGSAPHFGELNRRTAASTGIIYGHSDSAGREPVAKHKRSASLTVAAPEVAGSRPAKSQLRGASHVRNKRKAPQPPSCTGPPPQPKLSDSPDRPVAGNGSLEAATVRDVPRPRLQGNDEPLVGPGEDAASARPESSPPQLPKKTVVGKRGAGHDSQPVANDADSNASDEQPGDQDVPAPILDAVPAASQETTGACVPQGSDLAEGPSRSEEAVPSPKGQCKESKISSDSGRSSPAIAKGRGLDSEERCPPLKPDGQMNLQALQDLVESLVDQYCGRGKLEQNRRNPGIEPDVLGTAARPSSNDSSSGTPPSESWTGVPSRDGSVADEELANRLMERWQHRMRQQLLDGDEQRGTSQEVFSSPVEGTSTIEVEEGDDNAGGIYEPIGNFMQPPGFESAAASGTSHSGGAVWQRRRSSTRTEDPDAAEVDDVQKDPFLFWRDLCARERPGAAVACRSASVKAIRRLSVNGQQQLVQGTDTGAGDVVSGSRQVSRARSFRSGAEQRFHAYENVFTATPHRMVVVDGMGMGNQYGGGAYWPPTPLVPYPSRPFAPFPAFAVLPYAPPVFADPHFESYANPSYSPHNYPGAKVPSRCTGPQGGEVDSGPAKGPNRRQAVKGGSASRKLTKSCPLQACRSTRRPSSKANGCREPSPPPDQYSDTETDDSSDSDDSDVDKLAVNRLLKQLEVAISCGRLEEAATRARDLAQLKIQCSVVRNRQPKGDNQPAPVILNMFVEDKVSHHGPIPIRIIPSASVLELKKKIFQEFDFPVVLQRWILGRKLAMDDAATLASFGVDTDGCPVFLYLLNPDDVPIRSTDLVWDDDTAVSNHGTRKKKSIPRKPKREKRACRRKSPIASDGYEEMDARVVDRAESNSMVLASGGVEDCDSGHSGWQCVMCTLNNPPFRPGCAACGEARPESYVVPSHYEMPDTEVERLEQEEQQQKALKEAEELRRLENWQQYLHLDDQDLVLNDEAFECSICYLEAAPGEGVKLRDCLHSFCCDCLRNAIGHCEDAAVKCPFRDDLYSCDSVLQEREVRALVPANVFERYLQRSMATAESQAKNSFHCKTPDCQGWCIFEDNANEFACPICCHLNCITCRAIHEEMNCRQYQDKLTVLARTDEEAKKTKDAFEEMLQNGEAMHCPNCQVIIMKKWGCDWLCCSFCKTEICWVTKGPRWGPKGRGDVSGGCKCGTTGVRCHPKCNYCH